MTWQWLVMLGVAAIAALMFRRYVGFVTRAQAHSMWPTLRPGQFLFTRSIVHRGQIRHGDIAVVQSAELGRYILKRVVGLPGDRLVLGPRGLVRNGIGVAEPYVPRASGTSGSWLVPEGHCFLLGDNRAASCDSRCWRQPFAPLDKVVGRVRAPNASRRTEARLTAISARSVHTSAWGWIHVVIGVLLAAIGVGNDRGRGAE
jgi:signal peptidase I